jgi:hypothetical protein
LFFLNNKCKQSNAARVAVLVLATRGGVVRRAMAAVLLAANFAGVYEDDMAITLTMSLQTIMRGKMCLLHEFYYYGYVYVDLCKKSTKNWGSDIFFIFGDLRRRKFRPRTIAKNRVPAH